ncbi:MAG TPA: peptidylprolyl isomerase, partial [Novosphingobium sp.]|nr:peptidylprolyl isomerase [Novosphingobium sp.]
MSWLSQGVGSCNDELMSLLALLAAVAASPEPVTLPAKALAPAEIVATAPAVDWLPIAATELLVMDLAPDAAGRPRRVVIQLLPAPFSQGWIGNIRKLAAAHWWDGTSINRAQDNYVVQWGDPDGEDKAKAKPLPAALIEVPQSEYVSANFYGNDGGVDDVIGFEIEAKTSRDPYAATTMFHGGFPVAGHFGSAWPIHCYGTVGVGRNEPPDTGSGAELYAVIGH